MITQIFLMKNSFLNILLVAFVIVSFNSHAQTCLWGKTGAGSGMDLGTAATSDASGNIYVTGDFQSGTLSFGSKTVTNADTFFRSVFLTKYDASGNVLWARSFGGDDDDLAAAVTTDVWGNVYLTGTFRSSSLIIGSTTLINKSGKDIYLIKYNSSGNVIWAKSTGGASASPYNRDVSCVTTDNSGNVYIAGYFDDTMTFDSHTLVHELLGFDIFFTKYDSAGNVVWVKQTRGTSGGGDFVGGLAIDGAGNIYISGEHGNDTTYFDGIGVPGFAGEDLFLAKYNSSGNIIWVRSIIDTTALNNAANVAINASGDIYLAGEFAGSSIKIGTSTFNNSGTDTHEIFLAKYDTAGNVIWARAAHGTDEDDVFSMVADPSGNVFLTGLFQSTSLTFGTSVLTVPTFFLVKYDKSGNVVWAKDASGFFVDMFSNAVLRDPSGYIYIAGDFGVSVTIDAVTLNAVSFGQDVFLAKFNDAGAGVSTISNPADIRIYPNPASNNIVVASSKQLNKITVTNVLGQIVYDKMVNSKKEEVDISSWSPGVYTIRLNDAQISKFVKE